MQVATKSKNAQRLSWETQWKFILTSFKHHNLLSGLRIRRTCVLEVFDWPYIFRYGGIYLDDTQIVTRSMDPLRKLSCSMPYEKKGTLMNGVIVAEPNAAFLKKWFFLGYQDFEVSNPIYFSPYRLLPFFFLYWQNNGLDNGKLCNKEYYVNLPKVIRTQKFNDVLVYLKKLLTLTNFPNAVRLTGRVLQNN